MIEKKDLDKYFGKIKKLSTLPTVVAKLIKIIEDPDSKVEEVMKVISEDQAMVTNILKMVNSASYSLTKKITSLSQAIVIIGFYNLKQLVIGTSVVNLFLNGTDSEFSREEFWRHSVATASTARLISKNIKYPYPEEAFVGGLIHDIGKLILEQYLHKDFMAAIEYAEKRHVALIKAEEEMIGVNHAEVGAYIAQKWRLPKVYVDVLATHHKAILKNKELTENQKKLIAIVKVSNNFVKKKGIGESGNKIVTSLTPPYLNFIGITLGEIDRFYEWIKGETEVIMEQLGIKK